MTKKKEIKSTSIDDLIAKAETPEQLKKLMITWETLLEVEGEILSSTTAEVVPPGIENIKAIRDKLIEVKAKEALIEPIVFEKYVPEYVQKRAAKERVKKPKPVKVDPDAGKPFTPPLKTSDVAGL